MNTQLKQDLKFTMQAVLICLLIALAVRSYNEIKDSFSHSNTPTELNK